MSTGKTVLIVGGVVVGAFVLMKLIAPPAQPRTTVSGTVSQLGSIVSGLQGIGSGLSNLFSGSTAGNASSASPSFAGGAYADPTSQGALHSFDTHNYSVANGFEFTDANGNFIAG